MGGASPILKYSQAQAQALSEALEARGYGVLPTYVAMRYWHPFTQETLEQIVKDGIERLVVLPLYPHFSYTTTGSSLNELQRIIDSNQYQLELSVIPGYYDHPQYLKALADNLQYSLDHQTWGCPKNEVTIVFSAHSLPLKHVKRTQDPYPDQIYDTAQQVAETYFPNNPWELAFQSQVGKMPWLGPSMDGILHYFSAMEQDNLLILAISFVSDHVETLVEIDHEYLTLARELGIQYCHRAPALNVNAAFISALADVTSQKLDTFEQEGAELSNRVPDFKTLLQQTRHPSLNNTAG
jgi:ferrochelatase